MKFSFPVFFWFILLLIALGVGTAFTCLFTFPDAGFPLEKGERVTVLPGETLVQPFVSDRDGLRKLEVLFGNFDLEGDTEVVLELRDGACEAVLVQKTLSRGTFTSEHTYGFVFDRIPDSGGQNYCFAARVTGTAPLRKDKAPRFFLDVESTAPPHSIIRAEGESVGAGPIAIRPGFTNASFWENARELADRMSQYKPWFLKSGFLMTFATLGFLLTFGVVALLIREKKEA